MISPPTDNLYKFMSIVGVIIVMGSMYIPFTLKVQLEEKQTIVDTKISILEAEVDFAEKRSKEINDIVNNTIARQNGRLKKDTSRLEISYSESELKQLQNDLDVFLKTLKISVAEKEQLINEESRLSYYQNLIWWVSLFTIIFGVFLSVKGFMLWYYKIQYYQDIQLKNSVTDKEAG